MALKQRRKEAPSLWRHPDTNQRIHGKSKHLNAAVRECDGCVREFRSVRLLAEHLGLTVKSVYHRLNRNTTTIVVEGRLVEIGRTMRLDDGTLAWLHNEGAVQIKEATLYRVQNADAGKLYRFTGDAFVPVAGKLT